MKTTSTRNAASAPPLVADIKVPMRKPAATLTTAANGHLKLSFGRATPLFALWLKFKLQFIHGFRRKGRNVRGFGEAVVPDFVRGNIRLLAGWDNWSGLYLLSESEAGDKFLVDMAKKYI